MASRNDDFLSRWSRRKAKSGRGLRRKLVPPGPAPDTSVDDAPEQVAAAVEGEVPAMEEVRAEEGAVAVPDAAEDQAVSGEPDGDEEEMDISEFDDVDFDKLDYNSDYSRFMQKGVPQTIRRRALQMLWQSNPILANVDGLNDYDDDFTDAALAVKGLLKTAYKPGTGYITEEERRASYVDAGIETESEDAPPATDESEEVAEIDDDADADAAHDAGDAGDSDGLDEEEDFGTEPSEEEVAEADTDAVAEPGADREAAANRADEANEKT